MYKEGFQYYAQPPQKFPRGKINDGGLLILSKFPIVMSSFMPFKRLYKTMSNKGILYAKI